MSHMTINFQQRAGFHLIVFQRLFTIICNE